MPTINVNSKSFLELQEIADTLGKSRKVVVVTGAGISTNCGIPVSGPKTDRRVRTRFVDLSQDFRSENGLYSLIQAQYDAALQNPPWENKDSFDIDDRPKKKRRVTDRWYYEIVPATGPVVQDTTVQPSQQLEPSSPRSQSASQSTTCRSTPAAQRNPESSPLSSPRSLTPPTPFEDFSIEESSTLPPQSTGSIAAIASPRSRSSSSEPSRGSIEFSGDVIPKETLTQSDSSTPTCSTRTDDIMSTIVIEQGQQFQPSPPNSTCGGTSKVEALVQSSSTRQLPNLKGRDLFDSMVWSDPFTTSIFYMFISSLREKIRNEVKSTTATHKFLRTLRDGGRLVRNYTQNIDCLEEREGLSTNLMCGPGSKARFHAKTQREARPGTIDRDSPFDGGVECVLLHGGLDGLRCGICGRVCSWESDLQSATLSGSAPDCPSCTDYNTRRTGRGRRGLAVGRLRPNIVLYGEEHPNANLIAPLVTHDLSLGPDFLLIMGTSLRVHGLKILVKEFAKAVHLKGGKVVFVNRTKPPESTWGDFIDYWVEWDCDDWVLDLKQRRKDLWLPQGSQVEIHRKDSTSDVKMERTSKTPRTQGLRPQAVRDDKMNGIYHTFKILDSLRQFEDSSGRISTRPIYWEKPVKVSIAPVTKAELSKDVRKSLPAARKTSRPANSKKRKSCPSSLPIDKSTEKALDEVWKDLRKKAPSLGSERPETGKILVRDLLCNRGFPIHNLFMHYRRSFPDQSANRFPELNGLSLLTHPPFGTNISIHTPKKVEKLVFKTKPISHSYGTRSSARVSERSAELTPSDPLPASTVDIDPSHNFVPAVPLDMNTTIVADLDFDDTFPHTSLPAAITRRETAVIMDDIPVKSSPRMPGESNTIVVDDIPSPRASNEDTIVVVTSPSIDEKPPSPLTGDPMTPIERRIKRMGSIGAILSSPEDGSSSDASAATEYFDAIEDTAPCG